MARGVGHDGREGAPKGQQGRRIGIPIRVGVVGGRDPAPPRIAEAGPEGRSHGQPHAALRLRPPAGDGLGPVRLDEFRARRPERPAGRVRSLRREGTAATIGRPLEDPIR